MNRAAPISVLTKALVAIMRSNGGETIHNFPHPVLGYQNDGGKILYRTPFTPIPVSHQATAKRISPQTQRAMYKAYGLDIWFGEKVLSVCSRIEMMMRK